MKSQKQQYGYVKEYNPNKANMRLTLLENVKEKVNDKLDEIPIPLPLKLKKNGFAYTQVLRNGKAYIYMQRVAENCLYYEVFLRRVSLERILKGKTLPSKIKFPHDEAFGKWAWTFPNLDKALNKFLNLINNNKTK